MAPHQPPPPEILEIIFSLVNDVASLKACSLAGRSLTPSSQRVLLSTIHLTPPRFSDSLLQKPTKCKRFLALVTESPHLAYCVHSLVLKDGDFSPHKCNEQDYDLFWLAGDPTLTPVLDTLSQLKSLTIIAPRVYWPQLPDRARTSLLNTLSKVTIEHLELHFAKYPIPLLLRPTTTLSSLILRGQCDTEDPIPVDPSQRRPKLRSLTIDEMSLDFDYNIGWLVDPLQCCLDISHTERLALRVHGGMKKHKAARKLLTHLGGNLDYLSLTPSPEVFDSTIEILAAIPGDPLVLDGLTHITSLTLHLNWDGKRSGLGTPFPFLLHFFSNLSTIHNLRHLTLCCDFSKRFDFAFNSQGHALQNQWFELGLALSNDMLPALRELLIYTAKSNWPPSLAEKALEETEERIRKAMPALQESGVLKFDRSPSVHPHPVENAPSVLPPGPLPW